MIGSASPRFGRVLTAMATAMDQNGGVDYDGTVDLAKWLVENGSDALVVTGTTGEAPTLTDDEKVSLWEAVSSSVSVPVIAGSGSNDTLHSMHMTSRAQEVGVAGVLIVTPYYNRPPQSGILAHFEAVANETDLPVLIYDIPVRTGRKVDSDTLLELASRCSNVVALKDAAGDPAATARLAPRLPKNFEIFSGDDGLTLPLLTIGAVGVIGVATHWVGFGYQELISAFLQGNVVRAQMINEALLNSVDFESKPDAPNPMPVKVMLNQLGLSVGGTRLPLGAAPSYLANEAIEVFTSTNVALDALGVKVAVPKKEIRG